MNIERSSNDGTLLKLLLMLFGAGLNHTAVIGGVNLSFSDLILPLLIIYLAVQNKLKIPANLAAIFAMFSALILISSALITPSLLNFQVDGVSVLANYFKLVICFIYFVVAYSLASNRQIWIVFRSFVAIACACALVGVCAALLPALPVPDSFFYASVRYKGLMNDPNYFAVTQTAALAILVGDRRLANWIKGPAAIILTFSALLSGSKTGLFALAGLAIWWSFSWAFKRDHLYRLSPLRLTFSTVAIILGCIVATQLFDARNRQLVAVAIQPIPGVNRLAPLLLDFDRGAEMGGSGRMSTWEVALQIIGVNPISGIGVGTYLDVSEQVGGERLLAHNSLLQLAAEWGVLVTVLFACAIVFLLVRGSSYTMALGSLTPIRDATMVILIGSFGISLNNSRLFWVVLGTLLAVAIVSRRDCNRVDQLAPKSGVSVDFGFCNRGSLGENT